jgi:hypothetical protein
MGAEYRAEGKNEQEMTNNASFSALTPRGNSPINDAHTMAVESADNRHPPCRGQ